MQPIARKTIEARVKLMIVIWQIVYRLTKAIDVLDEVGARKHIKNINVPENIIELENITYKTGEK
jgi:ATP-dependent Clp protease ATP-binding subunit ClpC